MSAGARALLLSLGGVVVVLVGLVQLGVTPAAMETSAGQWWLRLGYGWAVLVGLVIIAAGLRWRATGAAQRDLTRLALAMGALGVVGGVLGGFLLGLDTRNDGGDAIALGLLLALQHGIAIMLAAVLRSESIRASGPTAHLDVSR